MNHHVNNVKYVKWMLEVGAVLLKILFDSESKQNV